jgi:hypothetical protein
MFFPGLSVKEEEQSWIVCNRIEEAKRRKSKLERGEQEKTNKRGSEGRGKKMG